MPGNSKQDLEYVYKQLNNTEAYYPKDKTIIRLFEEQVEKTPDATAVIYGDQCISYKELNTKSNQVAYLLRQSGFGRNSIIAIMVERSFEMIIGIYGILKSGAAYLPISPDIPVKRIEHIISDSNIRCLLSQLKFLSKFEGPHLKCIDLTEKSIYTLPEYKPTDPAGPSDLMYVIYTSGSTGNPKGVMIENYSVVNRINWMQKKYPITASDTILQKTPFVFDVSVWELFWWAVYGAKVCMLGPGFEKFPQALVEEVKKNQITVLHFVPTMLNSFLNYINNPDYVQSLNTLRYVFSSGEALLPLHVRKFNEIVGQNSKAHLVNLYGPTEATVDVTYYDCPECMDIDKVPIGKPIDNIRLYVLDGDELQPPGSQGELCIAGDGLARGYLNSAQLTNEKFIKNPTNTGERVYKTGDFVRLLPDGNIEYIGRTDNQVKIRGIRIELGEIEAKICEYGSVEQCVVVLKDYEKVNPTITAYILTVNKEMTVQEIKIFLKAQLPDYMIPNNYVIMDSFPLTSNGKIDRKALCEQ